jgi:hypothetical protein
VTGSTGDEPLHLLGRRVPPAFALWVRVLPAGSAHPVDQVTWNDALVEVAEGEIELEFTGGERRRFGAGDVLWLEGLPLRVLRNRAPCPAVLVAIRRRR